MKERWHQRRLDLTTTFLYNRMGVAGAFRSRREDAVARVIEASGVRSGTDGQCWELGSQLRCDHLSEVERLQRQEP